MAILATQSVLTLDNWKLAKDICVGDYVFDSEGKLAKVKIAKLYESNKCYEARFNDHLTVQGDSKLRLPLEDLKYRLRSDNYKGRYKFKRPLKIKSIDELLSGPLQNDANISLYSLPTAKPLQLPHQVLPVPPFIFGFWFFNRRSRDRLIPPRGKSEFIHEKFRDSGYRVRVRALCLTTEREFDVKPSVYSHLAPFTATSIPNNYLLSAPDQRFELLQGILHSKNNLYNKSDDLFRFTSKRKLHITQIQFLAESLGCKTAMYYDICNKTYILKIKTRLPFSSDQPAPTKRIHQARRTLVEITPIKPQLCVHIETNNKNQSILVGEGFISCL